MENNTFVWTPELENQFAEFAWNRLGIYNISASCILSMIDEFKKSKEVKKEKDYEIISFTWTQHNPRNLMWILQENGSYRNNYGAEFSYNSMTFGNDNSFCVENGKMKIHSVRRISDNEVFTIGDKILTYSNVIDKIEIDNGWQGGVRFNCGNEGSGLRFATKPKSTQSLFTKEQEQEIISLIKRYV